MDALTLDHLIAELDPLIRGRRLGQCRLGGAEAIAFEISGDRDHWLWLETARGRPGLYRLERAAARNLARGVEEGVVPGRTRQALLLFRKHLPGRAVQSLHRVPGERVLVMEAGGGLIIALRLSGVPALTLVGEGVALSTLGAGPSAWPLPPPAPEREWNAVDPLLLSAAAEGAAASGRRASRALLGVCSGLGPLLCRELDGSPASLASLRARLASPRPTLLAPGPEATWHDADLVAPDAVALAPIPLPGSGQAVLSPPSWLEAAALFVIARTRGARFERLRRRALSEAARRQQRLARLEAHLVQDQEDRPDATRLRREAEALLVFSGRLEPGARTAEIPDPYDPHQRLEVAVDPSLSAPGNADRLFQKARRVERARGEAAARLAQTRAALAVAQSQVARLQAARDLTDLEPREGEEGGRPPGGGAGAKSMAGSRHYLTSRGLSLLVGRGARENHHLTFQVARPDDLWLHARDVPGAHVILRDPGGRAAGDDFREAAEVAAFFSQAAGASQVDVHLARRKHLRPVRGARGRVLISHSDTLRVAPRDPEGRLRRR